MHQVKENVRRLVSQRYTPQCADALEFRVPSQRGVGDVAIEIFALSRLTGMPANILATEIAGIVAAIPEVSRAIATGPYVNLTLNRAALARQFCADATGRALSFKEHVGKRVLIEHTSINPNASPHIGRARNAILGDALARAFRYLGNQVEVHYYVNNIGKQIALLVHACSDEKGLGFDDLLSLYVDISAKAEAEEEKYDGIAFGLLSEFERGNESVRNDFKRIVDLCVAGQVSILERLGIRYDRFDLESDYLDDSRLAQLLNQLAAAEALFIDEEKRLVIDLRKLGFEKEEGRHVILRRANGTTMYLTRDLAYGIHKSEIESDVNLVVLGEDHRLYHQQLSLILKSTGYHPPEPLHYSFVLLKSEKMSTRKGKVVLLSDLLDEAKKRAAARIASTNPELPDTARDTIAEQLAVGAVRFGMLAVSPQKNVAFDYEEALRFEGNTGPYVQYACVRINSILSKLESIPPLPTTLPSILPVEWELVLALARFSDEVERAVAMRNPSLLCAYSLELARLFNRFYHDAPILDASDTERAWRASLCLATKIVLQDSLEILGIEVPARM